MGTHSALSTSDAAVVEALRAGDEEAFTELVRAHHESLVRLAQTFVRSRAIAEEVAQEAWLGVLRGIDRFEGRSSLRSWIFRILVYRAKTRAVREPRPVPFSELGLGPDGPVVNRERFLSHDRGEWPGHWASPPTAWDTHPESQVIAHEAVEAIRAAVDALPPGQRAVVTLRDVHGFSSEEVCDALGITAGNQRVMLHRGRARVRDALERFVAS